MGGRATSVENQSDSEDSEEFRVEKIVDMKTEGGKRQFLIKWKVKYERLLSFICRYCFNILVFIYNQGIQI